MSQRRQSSARFRKRKRIDFGQSESIGSFADVSKDAAPGINNHRMAVRFTLSKMHPDLCRGDHIGQVFDRAGAEKNLPVIAPGEFSEGRRDQKHIRAQPT